MDVNMPSSSAMEATKYSKYVSLMGVKALELGFNDIESNKNNCNGCNCKNKQGSKEELTKRLCYACRHIVQDLVRICLLTLINLINYIFLGIYMIEYAQYI